ncbi:MAG: histidine kinase dimerization/phospho-acceptor domain-containing protein [Acidobacteriota bacterium]
MWSSFAFSASHDLREPIRNIAIHAELVASRFGNLTDEDGRKSLGYLIQGARRLDTLVSDLLKYTTISKIDDPVEVVDAEESLRASMAMLAESIRENDAAVTYDPLPKAANPRHPSGTVVPKPSGKCAEVSFEGRPADPR